MKRLLTQRLIGVLFSVMAYQSAWAHAGVDHNKSCFLTVGHTKLRISGYLSPPGLGSKSIAPVYQHPAGRHFCHFSPGLGQIALEVESMAKGQEKTLVTLELESLTSRLNPDEAFTVINRQPEQSLEAGGFVSIPEVILQRGIYALKVTLQDASGQRQQQRFVFLAGFPVTKILVMIAGILVLVIGFAAVRDFKKKP